MTQPNPLEDARALLVLVRVLYRTRLSASATGVQPAAHAVKQLEPLGRALAAAVESAEQAETDAERARALADVAQLGERVSQTINDRWEGIGGLLGTLIWGVRGYRSSGTGPPGQGRGSEP